MTENETPTTRRGTQLENKRDVTRISANGCVIGHDHVIFLRTSITQ
jgi:hypothetical protein